MRKFLLLSICFCVVGFSVLSQELKDPNYYYALPNVSQDAKDCYAQLFDINNSPKSFSILDSMFTQNKDTQPFYIYLACTMLPKADGELRTQLNIVCRHLTEQDPDAVANVLYSKSKLMRSSYRSAWGHRVGVEIRLTCETDPTICFKRSRSRALQNCADDNKDKLEAIYNLIRQDMSLHSQR